MDAHRRAGAEHALELDPATLEVHQMLREGQTQARSRWRGVITTCRLERLERPLASFWGHPDARVDDLQDQRRVLDRGAQRDRAWWRSEFHAVADEGGKDLPQRRDV